MPDMLVNLYQLPDPAPCYRKAEESGVRIIRALAPDMIKVLEFVKKNFGEKWTGETLRAFALERISCFIAVKDHEVVGFAVYNATAKGYFGPTGIRESERGQGIGAALLLKCLEAQREEGYGYSIIGWAGPTEFYERICNARVIENDRPNIYSDMI